MTYRPLSYRERASVAFDGLHDGIPEWLQAPVLVWFTPNVLEHNGSENVPSIDRLLRLQARMRLDSPLDWTSAHTAYEDVRRRVIGPDGLDFLDYALQHPRGGLKTFIRRTAQDLDSLLVDGGSLWEVSPLPGDKSHMLTRRALGPTRAIIDSVAATSERAGSHLVDAWRHLAGRSPVPDQAYFSAVLAVEAAAKPIVSPNDSQATLGKMLAAVRTNPDKWAFTLGDPSAVVDAGSLLWKGHRRHGTDDREEPTGMSQAEADAGVHLAVTLVRWFASGAFTAR